MIFSNTRNLLFPLIVLSSFALQAMEQPDISITTIDGQEVHIPLDLAKKSSFLSGLCGDFSQDNTSINLQEMPESDVLPLLTADNIRMLKDLYTRSISLDHISNDKIPMLFRLAHWFLFDDADSPLYEQSILVQLAQRCFELPKIDNETKDLARDFLPACKNIQDLINIKLNDYIKNLYDPVNGILDLSYARLKKKLLSLEGIEKLMHIINQQYANEYDEPIIVILNVQDQGLTDFNIKNLCKVFPKLRQINLAGNRITRITRTSLEGMPKEIMLDLRNNQINEIENGCFDDFERFNQNIIKLEGNLLSPASLQEALRNGTITLRINSDPAINNHLRKLYYRLNLKNFAIQSSSIPITLTLFTLVALLYKKLHKACMKHIVKYFSNERKFAITLYGTYGIGALPIVYLAMIGSDKLYDAIDRSYSPDHLNARAALTTPYHLYVTTDHGNFDFPTLNSL